MADTPNEKELDTKIQDAAKIALDLATESKSWIWKLLGGALLALSLWYVRRQLDKKAAELAQTRAELELLKLEAQQMAVRAKLKELTDQASALEASANEMLAHAAVLEEEAKAAEERHENRVKALQTIKSGDWDALNKLAGVTP